MKLRVGKRWGWRWSRPPDFQRDSKRRWPLDRNWLVLIFVMPREEEILALQNVRQFIWGFLVLVHEMKDWYDSWENVIFIQSSLTLPSVGQGNKTKWPLSKVTMSVTFIYREITSVGRYVCLAISPDGQKKKLTVTSILTSHTPTTPSNDEHSGSYCKQNGPAANTLWKLAFCHRQNISQSTHKMYA